MLSIRVLSVIPQPKEKNESIPPVSRLLSRTYASREDSSLRFRPSNQAEAPTHPTPVVRRSHLSIFSMSSFYLCTSRPGNQVYALTSGRQAGFLGRKLESVEPTAASGFKVAPLLPSLLPKHDQAGSESAGSKFFNAIALLGAGASGLMSCATIAYADEAEIRDEGAFAIAQALKANEDVRLSSLNLMNYFLTKLGQSIW